MKYHRICSAALAAAMVLSLAACQSGGSESGSASSEPKDEAGVAVQIQEVAVDTISTGSSVSGQVVDDSGQESVFVSANARLSPERMRNAVGRPRRSRISSSSAPRFRSHPT